MYFLYTSSPDTQHNLFLDGYEEERLEVWVHFDLDNDLISDIEQSELCETVKFTNFSASNARFSVRHV